MDPARFLTIEDENMAFAIYNGLTRVDPQMKVHPDLATSWNTSDDLKTWTFKLRSGVKFHHGKVFNADDVVFSFTRILDPKLASPGRSVLNVLEGVEKKDDSTAIFHLKQPYADLPVVVGGIFGRIVPSDRGDDQILKEPSGTGPFKFQENVIGDHLTVVRNPDYWQPGLPYLDGIRQVTMPEQASRDAALGGGQIDMIWQVYPTSRDTLKQFPNVKLYSASSGGYVPLVMRSDRPPFDDVRVRQAMKYVVDREQIRQVVMLGAGDLANDQPIPPALPLYTDIGLRTPDVARAKQLLSEAGHPNGLDLTLYTSPGRPGMVELAVAFQQMAAPAGIRVKIQKVPIDSFWADYWMKKDFYASNWFMRSTIDETLSVAYKSDAQWNEAFWKSPKLDDLILAGRGERDESKRKQIYAQAARLISDEGGSIITYFQPVVSAASTAVQGFDEPPLSLFDPRTVWLAQQKS
jgi:peptide/nickel transport system substrate-binding protein